MDILERLYAAADPNTSHELGHYWNLCDEAAEYIEELASDKGRWYRMCELHCQTIDRMKNAMREAMYLLDQKEPRAEAAFSTLLLALNPELESAKRKYQNQIGVEE